MLLKVIQGGLIVGTALSLAFLVPRVVKLCALYQKSGTRGEVVEGPTATAPAGELRRPALTPYQKQRRIRMLLRS
jgi:hypothetical protein